ncbi:hypothetical protein D6833_05205, partial [Candidatus Parcubacteria bacterium]
TATRFTANLLQWQPADAAGGLIPGGTYTLAAAHLTDLNGNPATASATFTHLNTNDEMLLLAYQTPTDTQPEGDSAYGLTTLFQGRTWHAGLGAYYYRARWYLPKPGVFAERDPLAVVDSPALYQFVGHDPVGIRDPFGESIAIRLYTKHSRLKSATLDLVKLYVSAIFRAGFWWKSPSEVSVRAYPYSLEELGDYAPEHTPLPKLPRDYNQVGEFFTGPEYAALLRQARAHAATYGYHFRAYVEMNGNREPTTRDSAGESSHGYAIVYEKVVWGRIREAESASGIIRDEHYNAMLFSVIIAHEVGHQFGLSPQDQYSGISGLGVMATRETFVIHQAAVSSKLIQAEARARKRGVELTPEEKMELWLETFRFSEYDRRWIRLLSDQSYDERD